MRNLFLDDIRIPLDCVLYTKEQMFASWDWDIVRNYDEFVAYIQINGMPDFISFDHDLADTHYTPEHLWTDYEASKKWQEEQVHTEKTGYHCAKWLVEYCMDNNCKLPQYYCHSMNPVGKDWILGVLDNYNKQ